MGTDAVSPAPRPDPPGPAPDATELPRPGRADMGGPEPAGEGQPEPAGEGESEPTDVGQPGVGQPDRAGVGEPDRAAVSEPQRAGGPEHARVGGSANARLGGAAERSGSTSGGSPAADGGPAPAGSGSVAVLVEMPAGVRVGHWTGDGTGVTVVLPPAGTVGSGEVRGGAPATREFALLAPERMVDRVDAVVLSGGSAFGLAAGDGVMRALRDRGEGFATAYGPVPIVVGMSIFDASVATAPPDAASGRDALLAALAAPAGPVPAGRVGAGTGAVSGRWHGRRDPGGFGAASARDPGGAVVTAFAVVNAFGSVTGPDGHPLPASHPAPPFGADLAGPAPDGSPPRTSPPARETPATVPASARENTTLVVVVTDATLTKTECLLLAQSGHDGMARALHPAHTRFDGDAVVALATGGHPPTGTTTLDTVRATAIDVVATAIRNAASPTASS